VFFVNSRSFFWAIPFISFLLGYIILYHALQVSHVATPDLVGKTVEQAVAILSESNLNMRLLQYKEDATLAPGTIISQIPQAGQQIKPQQSLFLTVSRHALAGTAPNLLDQRLDSSDYLALTYDIKQIVFRVPSNYPQNYCVAQIPAAGELLEDKSMIVYTADSSAQKIIWPDFVGKRVHDVRDFLQAHDIAVEIIHTYQQPDGHGCENCVVLDQRPLAGSLISLEGKNKQLQVQLLAQ
jgi:beta-lactam-binding protein with PASTA domain